MNKLLFAALFCFIAVTSATVFFKEDFDADWESRWVHSEADSGDKRATFVRSHGDWYNDAEKDAGIQTQTDARFYKTSAKFPSFSNEGKDLVIQYSVKNEQVLDCGGGYIKVGPSGLDQANFNGDSRYNVMFGPDQCGSTKRVHFIFNYHKKGADKDDNFLIKKTIRPKEDRLTHLYTAIVHPDQTYEVRIDNEKVESGSLTEDWDFLPAKEINDPEASKPADWVDEAQIDDPEASKPEGWDDIPKEIADPEATKPEDWDDELDGEWEAPQIPNAEYKGEWKAPKIANPAYQGVWVHPKIANPEFYTDEKLGVYEHGWVGFELWQVKSGTIFDHILITDSVEEAEAFANGHFKEQQAGEQKLFDKHQEEENARQEAEREAAKASLEEEDEDEEDHHHDHDHDEL